MAEDPAKSSKIKIIRGTRVIKKTNPSKVPVEIKETRRILNSKTVIKESRIRRTINKKMVITQKIAAKKIKNKIMSSRNPETRTGVMERRMLMRGRTKNQAPMSSQRRRTLRNQNKKRVTKKHPKKLRAPHKKKAIPLMELNMPHLPLPAVNIFKVR